MINHLNYYMYNIYTKKRKKKEFIILSKINYFYFNLILFTNFNEYTWTSLLIWNLQLETTCLWWPVCHFPKVYCCLTNLSSYCNTGLLLASMYRKLVKSAFINSIIFTWSIIYSAKSHVSYCEVADDTLA